MSTLNSMTEQLAASVLLATPDDLAGLASLHEKLKAVSRTAQAELDTIGPNGQQVSNAAQKASELVEQIILREVDDANAAIEQVCQQITQIQQLISKAGSGAAAETESKEGETNAAQTAPAAPAPETNSADPGAGEPLPKAEDLPLVGDFLMESREHLASAEADLLKLEEHPEDMDLLNSVFRSFHTIKGVAGFLNLKQIGKVAHAAETLLDSARKGQLQISGSTLDVVLDGLDLTKALINALETSLKNGSAIPAEPRIKSALERLRAAAEGKTPPAKAPAPDHVAAAQPAPTTTPMPTQVIDNVAPATPAPTPPQAPDNAAPAKPAPASSRGAEAEEARAGGAGAGAAPEGMVKVSTTRLDALINTVGELVIAQAMVSQDVAKSNRADQRMARNVAHLGKITRELQDLTMAMRMVPIQGVFQKMSRLVRDLARKSGKQIDLKLTGSETELDRNLVEAISDPLVHMVRNSADHGIEETPDRLKAGKSPQGHVELKAYHQAGNVVVEISDDGRGLNKAKILAKARQSGLIKEGQELSEEETFRLIFAPGLSTAEKITDVSGRGVGMDVVRRNVESLRGRIDITSAEGKGSTFIMRLPLTLAVIDGLVIKVGAARYILPITSIEQSLRPRREQLSTVQNRGEMCMIRNCLLPLCRLHKLFNVTPRTADPCAALLVLVQDGARRCCLLIDELLGQQQVVIKSLGEATGAVAGISGGAILGDGTISLILDVPGLIDLATSA